MDCSCLLDAITPCQIARMHTAINGAKQDFINTNYVTSYINLCDITGNQSYIAQSIEILEGSCTNPILIISGNVRVFLDAETVEIHDGFEADQNASFIVK